MNPPPSASRTVVARTGLLCLGGLALYGVGLGVLLTTTGSAIPCPFRLATGWLCPLCGSTRMAAALMHGDLGAAFGLNPGVLVALGLLLLLGLTWVVELGGGPRLRPPAGLRRCLRGVPAAGWWLAGVVGTAAVVLLRNLG